MNKVTSVGGLVVKGPLLMLIKLESGRYAIPKGHTEANESLEQTALREVEEETGIKAQIQGYLGELVRQAKENSGEIVEKTIKVYRMQQIGLSDHEQDEDSEWVLIDDAIKNMHFIEEANFIKEYIDVLMV
jgi:8-oxo-dGTP pyrophosphatase MutT (NUDIX family)